MIIFCDKRIRTDPGFEYLLISPTGNFNTISNISLSLFPGERSKPKVET